MTEQKREIFEIFLPDYYQILLDKNFSYKVSCKKLQTIVRPTAPEGDLSMERFTLSPPRDQASDQAWLLDSI